MFRDIHMRSQRLSVHVPCVRMLCDVAFLLLLHTKEVGLGGGSEPLGPISLQLPGLHCRGLADAPCHLLKGEKKKTSCTKWKK